MRIIVIGAGEVGYHIAERLSHEAHEIVVIEPMSQRSPQAGITAANRATGKALREVAQFVLDNAVD